VRKKIDNCRTLITKESPFLLHCIGYFLAYAITGFGVITDLGGYLRFKHLSLLYPTIFAIIAFSLNKLWEAKKIQLARLTIIFFVGVGFCSNVAMISPRDFLSGLKREGYRYFELGSWVMEMRTRAGIEQVISHMRWINPKYASEFLKGLSGGMFSQLQPKEQVSVAKQLFLRIPQEYHPVVYYSWGRYTSDMLIDNFSLGIMMHDEAVAQMQDTYRKSFYEGLGAWLIIDARARADRLSLVNSVRKRIEARFQPYFEEGINEGLKYRDE
jgi:hypothetical protein